MNRKDWKFFFKVGVFWWPTSQEKKEYIVGYVHAHVLSCPLKIDKCVRTTHVLSPTVFSALLKWLLNTYID